MPRGTFILSCYLFQTHIAMHFCVLLRNKSSPPRRRAHDPTTSKVEAIDTCPSQEGGSGASVRVVSASASLEGLLPILEFYSISAPLLVARGID